MTTMIVDTGGDRLNVRADTPERPIIGKLAGGAIFQLGGNQDPRWDGYDITDYLPALRESYGKP